MFLSTDNFRHSLTSVPWNLKLQSPNRANFSFPFASSWNKEYLWVLLSLKPPEEEKYLQLLFSVLTQIVWSWFARCLPFPPSKLNDWTVPVLEPKKNWSQPAGARLLKSQLYWVTYARDKRDVDGTQHLSLQGLYLQKLGLAIRHALAPFSFARKAVSSLYYCTYWGEIDATDLAFLKGFIMTFRNRIQDEATCRISRRISIYLVIGTSLPWRL